MEKYKFRFLHILGQLILVEHKILNSVNENFVIEVRGLSFLICYLKKEKKKKKKLKAKKISKLPNRKP